MPAMSESAAAHRAGLPAILAAVLIWGTMPFVIQVAARSMPAGELVALRLTAVGVLLALALGPRRLARAIRRKLGLFLVLAVVGFTLPHLCYVYALQLRVPIPTLTFITNSYPAMCIPLAVVFLRERPSRLHIVGACSALAGLYLLAGAELQVGGAWLGIACALVAALGWALAGVAGKRVTASLAPLEIVAGRHLLAGLFAAPLMLAEGATLQGIDAAAWLAVVALVVMSLLSFYCYYRGLARTSLSTTALLESFTPVVTLGFSVVLTGQGLTGISLLGAGLALVGAALASLAPAPSPLPLADSRERPPAVPGSP